MRASRVEPGRAPSCSDASPTTADLAPLKAVVDDVGSRPDRPLGLWAAAGLVARANGHRSRRWQLVYASALVTSAHRVEQRHAVATVTARDPISMTTWAALTVLACAGLLVALLAAVGGQWPMWLVAVPGYLVAVLAGVGFAQRATAWRSAAGCRRAMAITNVAAEPREQGHGTTLFAELVRLADYVGRPMVLNVDPSNTPAVNLYRRHGFVAAGRSGPKRMRMARPATSEPATMRTAPSWLAPIGVTVPALLAAAVAGVGLTIVHRGTPSAWLMLPMAVVAGIAADSDLRWRRIPNRLLALGSAGTALGVVILDAVFAAPLITPAIAGAALFAGPLFIVHLMRPASSGLGDAKVAVMLGMVCGTVRPSAAVLALLSAMVLGALVGALWQRTRGRGYPLAPALAVGTVVALAVWPYMEGPW